MEKEKNKSEKSNKMAGIISRYHKRTQEIPIDLLESTLYTINAQQDYWLGVLTYFNDFATPFWIALNSFWTREKSKIK